MTNCKVWQDKVMDPIGAKPLQDDISNKDF